MRIHDLDSFRGVIKSLGFKAFWGKFIQAYLAKKRPDLLANDGDLEIDFGNRIFDFDNIGELYEIGLEADNQISKKELGQYYTPKDTCEYMAKKTAKFFNFDTDTLADVCCGTGNLIIEVLSSFDKQTAHEIIKSGKLYLYDLDESAMSVAIMKICILFIEKGDENTFRNIKKLIHAKVGNFLDDNISLPENCVLISNPPYGKLPAAMKVWKDCETIATNDMYSVFMEKMSKQCKNAVIISPQSFLGGSKFKKLREILSRRGGYIFSFDNIPCPIFIGRKKGIFNTNTSNSVRAAITVIDNSDGGFRVSPMIRFRTDEREIMFAQLDKLLGDFVYSGGQAWTKIPKSLEPLVKELKKADKTIGDLIEKKPTRQKEEFKITVPSTPRYFISGSRRNLSRSSKIEIYAKNEEDFDRLYMMINSTFSYLWWRIYDGGITLTRQTLLTMPVPNLTTTEMKQLVKEGIDMENQCIVNKMNAGKNNENVKFPEEYRHKVNQVILSVMGFTDMEPKLFSVHSNNLAAVIPAWI